MKNILTKFKAKSLALLLVGLLVNACEFDNLTLVSAVELSPIAATIIEVQARAIDFSGQVTEHGFVWSEFSNPEVFRPGTNQVTLGSLNDRTIFGAVITELQPSKTYFIRAYLIVNGDLENITYSKQVSFFTDESLKPTEIINMGQVDNLKSTTASVGVVIDGLDGGSQTTSFGIYYATDDTPGAGDLVMVDNNAVSSTPTNVVFDLTDLTPATTYYARAFMVTTISQPGYGFQQFSHGVYHYPVSFSNDDCPESGF